MSTSLADPRIARLTVEQVHAMIYEQPRPDGSYQHVAVRRAGETVELRLADGECFEILADRILP